MIAKIKLSISTVAVMVLGAGSVFASDLAMVFGNRNYRHAETMYSAESALNSARSLRQAGYFVISGRDLSLDEIRKALVVMDDRLSQSERVIVMLNGHFVHSATDTWFVPVDTATTSRAAISYQGLSVSSILDILAERPGQAALFLGTYPRDIPTGRGLTSGIGTLTIPQGVFVATGKPDDIDLTFRRDFMAQGAGFAEALSHAPDSVSGAGFISNTASVTGNDTAAAEAAATEEGFWQAIKALNASAGFALYLQTYPSGQHAFEAQRQIIALKSQDDENRAKSAEDDLDLSRDERRAVQENLTLLGYDTRGVDGVFGRGTRAAIAAWQKDEGFDPTGYLRGRMPDRLSAQAAKKADELAREARDKQDALDREDRDFWRNSGAKDGEVRGLRQYLRQYPDGLFADQARAKLDALQDANRNKVSAKDKAAWDKAEAGGEIDDYKAYLDRFPKGAFADDAQAKIAELEDQASRKAEIDAAQLEEASLNMNILGRILVEKQLQAVGFEPGPTDGNFDDATRKAFRKFQRTRGFAVTGYLTRQTLVRLIAEAQGK